MPGTSRPTLSPDLAAILEAYGDALISSSVASFGELPEASALQRSCQQKHAALVSALAQLEQAAGVRRSRTAAEKQFEEENGPRFWAVHQNDENVSDVIRDATAGTLVPIADEELGGIFAYALSEGHAQRVIAAMNEVRPPIEEI